MNGILSNFSNKTATTMTVSTSAVQVCDDGGENVYQTGFEVGSISTVYNAFPAGDPDVNEFRIARTFPAIIFHHVESIHPRAKKSALTKRITPADDEDVFTEPAYQPAVPVASYGTVLYPNAAGTAINTMQATACPFEDDFDGDACFETDWNGAWFADDNGSGSGIVVFRDASSTNPAVLGVLYDPDTNANITAIGLVSPDGGWTMPFTETEWVCAYDPTTWTAAARAAGTLPIGCAQQSPAAVGGLSFSLPTLSAAPGTTVSTVSVLQGTFSAGTPITIVGGEYYSSSLHAYTSAPGTVNPGDYLQVQVTASPTVGGTASAIVTIGGVSSQFLVISAPATGTTAPTVALTANPTSVPVGSASTLTWSSTNATACTASGAWSGSEPVTGTQMETPTVAGTQSFTLTCTGAGGSANATATLNATALPVPTVTISVDPTTVTVGTASTLTWSSTNATACTASGAWSGSEPVTGTQMETPTVAGTQTFTLTCTGAGGSANATATLTATAPPVPTVTITVAPTTITVGDTASLTWSSTNSTSCTASGAWSGTQAVSGTAAESPLTAGSVVYTLACTGTGGSATASATLTVNTPQLVSTGSTGRIGGGGAIDVTTLFGLLSLTYLTHRSRQMRKSMATGKRTIIGASSVLAMALILASPGRAADDVSFDWLHGYVGIRAGESIYKPSVGSILNSVGPDADEIGSLTINSHQFGGVIYAGLPVWKQVSLEIGYAQIGQFPLSMTTVTAGGGQLSRIGAGAKVAATPRLALNAATVSAAASSEVDRIAQEVVDAAPPAGHGVTLGFALPIDVTSRFSIEPRFAALFYQSKQSLTTSDATLRNDSKGVGFLAGAAASARVFGPVYVGAGVDCFHQNRACNVLLLSGHIEYRFGR